MIFIQKGDAPESLKLYKKNDNAYYGGCNKDDIRDSLLKEQGHLCAYCMRRIYKETMKIEHWYPESRMTDKECLDYSNMLGCCPGHNEGNGGRQDTCDTHKGNSIIAINPQNSTHIDGIKYRSKDGTIYSDDNEIIVLVKGENGMVYEERTSFQHDIDITLNLNEEVHYLKQNRKAVLDALKEYIDKRCKEARLSAKDIRKLIKKYEQTDENGYREPYAGIALWYLKKKLKH